MRKAGLFKCLLLLFVFGFVRMATAQNYQLYTVYIYSFIRYIQWPNSEGDFVIGVVGDSPVFEYLEKMAAVKKAGDRVIQIKKFSSSASIIYTDILFISKESSGELGKIKERLGTASTLLVTEKEGMGVEGSAINFIERNGKPAFELNKASLEAANLKVSSELTRIAILI
jgi:hypothetical protein